MTKGKSRELKDIKLKEVSFVDKPANKRSFLFFKREHSRIVESVEKAKKIKVEIESDGTAKGTKVVINGNDLGELRDFNFSFWKGADEKSPVACSYSKVVESEDGFKRTETFHLSKGAVMNEKTLKALQKYLGVDEVDFEKSDDEEALQKAMNLITKNYKESFPQDLEEAVAVLAKCAVGRIEDKDNIEKAGARFSKDTIAKLKAIIAAAESLKQLIETSSGKTEKTEKTEKSEANPEFEKKIKELTDSIEAMKEMVEKKDQNKDDSNNSDDPLTKLTKAIESMSERLKAVEKGGATKSGIEGQDDDDDDEGNVQKGAGEDGKTLWPSLSS